ncbi:hemolysin family protein [Prescottella sp. R16]|uniref:hemolysin family protein n=1 Tax=Prescottella sp. R16 TaxID=3064529 RepID=UPI00272E334E|nr:hemolysin family protein [Prescottella sp. R16]
MTVDTVLDIALVLFFVVVGGVFAATEIALVSLRDSQIRRLSRRGSRGERTATLARNPNRFLSAVQIGVTVAGFFSAAYGASTIAPDIAPVLDRWGVPPGAAEPGALVLTTLVVAYLSLVLGELVPKRIALQRSTAVALATAPPLDRFATLMRPVIWLLSVTTDLLVRLLGGDPHLKGESVTHEELRELLTGNDALHDEERHVLSEVFDVGGRSLREVMRPRSDVDFLPASMTIGVAARRGLDLGHSRFPVVGRTLDDVTGFVHIRDLLRAAEPDTTTVAAITRPVLEFPTSKRVLPTLAEMRRVNAQIVVVVDEYGGTAGIATLEDIVEEIVGEIGDEFDPPPPPPSPQPRHLNIDGLLLLDDFTDLTGITLPRGPYDTVAGCVLHRLQRIPRLGDTAVVDGHRMTVSKLDGYRIAQVRLTPGRRTAPR